MRNLLLAGGTSVLALVLVGHVAIDYRNDRREAVTLRQMVNQQKLDMEALNSKLRLIEADNAATSSKLNELPAQLQAIRAAGSEAATAISGDLKAILRTLNQPPVPPVPVLSDLDWTTLGDRRAKIITSPINFGIDALPVLALKMPANITPVSAKLAYPWPKLYTETFKQEFTPYTFAQNMAFIAQQVRLKNDGWAVQVDYLLGQLSKFTNDRDEVFYGFKNSIFDGTLEAPWTSAFGNALVAIGLVEMADATKDEKFRALAKKYLIPITTAMAGSKTVRIDASDYLWFEETPELNGKPVSIYNGHTASVLALYIYQRVTGETIFEPYLRAGLATAARYMPESRRPGGIPVYARYAEFPDYGPLRAFNQANCLFHITGNVVFKTLADGLKTDVPYR